MSSFVDPRNDDFSRWFQLRPLIHDDEVISDVFAPWPTFDELAGREKEDWLVTRASDFRDWVLAGSSGGLEEFAHPEARFVDVRGALHFSSSILNFADVLGVDHLKWVTVDMDEQILEQVATTTLLLQEDVSPDELTLVKIVWSMTWIWHEEEWMLLNSHASYHEAC